MPKSVQYLFLDELKLRLTIYDMKVRQSHGPVSAEPVLAAARALVEHYTQVRGEGRDYHSDRGRRVRAERKAQGLCRVCGKEPHRKDRTTCPACGRREVEQAKKQYKAMKETR